MRFTNVLLRYNFSRAYKDIWKRRNKKPISDPQSVVELVEKVGIQVEDSIKIAGTYMPIYTESGISKPVSYREEDDPDYHSQMCHFFSSDTCLLEGLAHVQSLTKTCKIDGLPPKIEADLQKLHLSDKIKEYVDKGIMQAYIWDAHQDKLPKRFDETRPCHVFKREYGIPLHKTTNILLNELVRLSEVYTPEKDINKSRILNDNLHASTPIEKDGDLLQFIVSSDMGLTSRSPLLPNVGRDSTKDVAVPDIYPLKCTLDLQQKNVYKLINYSSFSKGLVHPFVHTIFLTKTDDMKTWSHSQVLGRAVGTCFSIALAQFRAIYGDDIKEVSTPVVIQCIQTDGKLFDFITYQLNTINLNGTDGVKNSVWIDDKRELMAHCGHVSGQPVLSVVDYDVVKRFFAFCTNS